jgi:uncharacterized protein (DUF362 family)/Pyruvate/2-oxoacid:ferredoxin oxidoreductase delta subunit
VSQEKAREKVSIVRCDGYDADMVYRNVTEAVNLVGGMKSYVSRGDQVLIKPNLLSARPPERAVLTHPAVVEAAIRLVIEAGGQPMVGDSPGFGSPRSCAERGGYIPILEKYDVPLLEFNTATVVKNPGGTFKSFEIAREILEADKIINLPKLKTHGQMVMTMAVKNLFGTVVGTRKSQWHLKIGNKPEQFARMLIDLHYMVNPVLSIMDGITAMEGNGPGSGDPVELGLIFAGADATAVDAAACRVVGLDPSLLYTLAEAKRMGISGADVSKGEILGESIDDVSVTGFKFTPTGPLMGSFPAVFSRIARRTLTPRPTIQHDRCTLCGQCKKICSAGAIAESSGESRAARRMTIDYDVCIRCFCCQEICPEGAIQIKTGWFPRART